MGYIIFVYMWYGILMYPEKHYFIDPYSHDQQSAYQYPYSGALSAMSAKVALETIDLDIIDTNTIIENDISTPFGRQEVALIGGFEKAVDTIDLASVLHLAEDRTKPPRTIDRYALVPITGEHETTQSLRTASVHVKLPSGVTCNYRQEGLPPYLDTSLAVGLTYDDIVVAIASAGIDAAGLTIKQLQATILKDMDRKQRYGTGLYSGILWRDTLVEAWCDISRQLGLGSVTLEGAANNEWIKVRGFTNESGVVYPTRTDAYDDVAERMGFYKTLDGDWRQP